MGLTKLIDLDLLDRFLDKVKALIPTKTSDITNDSGFITGMTILSYGNSTWQDFLSAYNANKVVYCRASSNSNPASGAQTRMAFMAYIGGTTDTPTSVEFQYYRSVNGHTDAQQGDQVYVYKLTNANAWSVTVRESYTKIIAGTGLSSSYNNGALTITDTPELPSVSSSDNDKVLTVVSGAWAAASPSGGNIEPMTDEEIWTAVASGWGSTNPTLSAAIWNSVAAGWSVDATMTDAQIGTAVASGWR